MRARDLRKARGPGFTQEECQNQRQNDSSGPYEIGFLEILRIERPTTRKSHQGMGIQQFVNKKLVRNAVLEAPLEEDGTDFSPDRRARLQGSVTISRLRAVKAETPATHLVADVSFPWSATGAGPCYIARMNAEITLATIEPVLRWLNLAGLSVFAVSGALVAARQRLDIVAACFFAIVAAIGGGTMRDVLIGAPVFWMRDPAPLVICLSVAVAVWLVPLRWWPVRALDWFDAAGLSAYSVYGAGKALSVGIAPLPAAAMGIVTACMGGVIRDVVAGLPSILLRNELYVTAAVLAAALFVGLDVLGLSAPAASLAGAASGFALRGAAIRWGLALPRHGG